MTKARLIRLLDEGGSPAAIARAMASFIGDAEIIAAVERRFPERKRGRPPVERDEFGRSALERDQIAAVNHLKRYGDKPATLKLFPNVPASRLDSLVAHMPGRLTSNNQSYFLTGDILDSSE